MKKLIELVQHHGFIAATSVAMFVHSTWTFNTLFAGEQPNLDGSLEMWVRYLMWVLPGALIALAIDVGQIQTSSKIKHARGWSDRIPLLVTFSMLAIAGYYLQWFHMAHHLPALDLGDGLDVRHYSTVELLKGLSIWIIPALLPLSTILYTVSDISESQHATVISDLSEFKSNVSIVDHAPLPSLDLGEWMKRDPDEFDPEEDDTEPFDPVVSESDGYGALNVDPALQSERAKKPRPGRKGARSQNGSVE